MSILILLKECLDSVWCIGHNVLKTLKKVQKRGEMVTDFPKSLKLMLVFGLVLGQTQFVGSEFGILGGFGWVCSLILVDKPGLRSV